MAYKYQGDAVLNVSLTVDTAKPLDSRSVVNNASELYTLPEKTAYPGMTVANIDNGNIYMLVDKSKIGEKAGWKASYESIQIITCTEAEYKEWKENTTDDFKPIDENKTYLHEETYYYIYEESIELLDDNYYLTAAWGRGIEQQLNNKASQIGLNNVSKDLQTTMDDLANNYTTTKDLEENYATIEYVDGLVNLEDEESLLSKALSEHYTKTETDEIFVTKESLRGGGETEGEEDDFIFVTQTQYKGDLEAIQEELDKTVKLDSEGSLESIVVEQIKSSIVEEKQLVVDVTPEGLKIGEDTVAVVSDIPVMVCLPEVKYLEIKENTSEDFKPIDESKEYLKEDTYYYVYDVENDARVYITKEYLDQNYHTTNQYQTWVNDNYYNKSYIDEELSKLQISGEYVTQEDIKSYYKSEEVDNKFITAELANQTFATQQSVTDLSDLVESDYVKKSDLKGEDTGDEDFIFVTQSTYTKDKEALAESITTKELSSDKVNTGEVTITDIVLTGTEQGLNINGKQAALHEEIPIIKYLTQSEYEDLDKYEEDTLYCTYANEDGYVKSETLEQYYNKNQIDQMIRNAVTPLEERIAKLEELVKTFTEQGV